VNPPALLPILAGTYGLITCYFCWRYYLRRRQPSLVCALMPLGWVAAFALQENRVPLDMLPLLFGVGMLVAGWSIYIVVRHEIARDKPFR